MKTEFQENNVRSHTFSDSSFVIPAIDIIEGKSVRLTQGDYSQSKIYNSDPLEVAKQFEGAGMRRLHLVDLDGAKSGSVRNWKVLEMLAGKTGLSIDFGGGIKAVKDVEIAFNSGAAFATVGSIAVTDEQEFSQWLIKFGSEKFFVGADVKSSKLAIRGWQQDTDVTVIDFINRYVKKGITQIFCTDISRDGMLEGPAIDLYKEILAHTSVRVIASGGVSSIEEVEKLKEIGCGGVIIGKALYENRISLSELKRFV